MMPSRGMGAIAPSKLPKTRRRKDGDTFEVYAEGGEVWDKPRPKGIGKPTKLTPAKKAAAKAAAKSAGRPYPNLVDNMRAAK